MLVGCEIAELEARVDDAGAADGGLERWACGDFVDGCGFRPCPVVLTANVHSGTGTVEFAGVVEYAQFKIHGLERRWDWCLDDDGGYGCAFVLSSDGDGAYYDFTKVMPDSDGVHRTKPSELFKCTRRRARSN